MQQWDEARDKEHGKSYKKNSTYPYALAVYISRCHDTE